LLKVGVAASLAALLVRWEIFRKVLFAEFRDSDLKVKLLLCLTPPLAFGVALRLVGAPYRFADLMLEGSFLLGLLGGRLVGPLGGAIVSVPAFFNHEWLAMPMAAAAGLAGGLIREMITTKESLWDFGPFTFLNLPRWIKRMAKGSGPGWETLPLAGTLALELTRQLVHLARPQWLFYLKTDNWWEGGLLLLATMMAVAVPIKIWNNTRIQMNLEQHQKLLLQARMAALTSQINPHFLFAEYRVVIDSL
jgi:two-component system LytT family sensor kinase